MPRAPAAAILLATGLVGLWLSGGTAWAQNGCENADALRMARLLGPALEEYGRLEAGAAPPGCRGAQTARALRERAQERLQQANRQFSDGATFSDSGLLRSARDGYASVLDLDASLDDARDNLERLTALELGDRDPCRKGEALRAARLLESAAAALTPETCRPALRSVQVARADAKTALEAGIEFEAAGDPAAARRKYVEAAQDASLDDARTRLLRLAAALASGPCAAANALFDARLLGPAREAYAELQREPDSPPCASVGATNTRNAQNDAEKLLADGKELEDNDQLAAAREKYKRAAQTDASLDESRKRLEDIAGTRGPAPERVSSWFTDDAAPWLGWGVALVLGVGLVVTLLLRIPFAKRRANRWIWSVYEGTPAADLEPAQRRRRPILRSLLALDRWALRVGLKIDDFGAAGAADAGKAVAKALQAHLANVGSRRTRTVDVVAAPFPAAGALSELTEAVKLAPQGRLWGAILAMIWRALPRETLTLSGQLLDARSRTGLSL